MQENEIKVLLQKYQAGQCTETEAAFLENWFAQWNKELPIDLSPDQLAAELQAISGNIPLFRKTTVRPLWLRIAAAASVLVFLSVGLYFFLHRQTARQTAQNQAQDIGPGSNKLILTLGNGKKIDLTTAKNGQIAVQGQTAIRKVSNGQVVYTASAAALPDVQYNTVSAPAGATGALTLADGTKVWLNAASSITFPTIFTGKKRAVKITGEVIIKPAHDPGMPFYASVRNQVTRDIGTEFDINAYDDEPVIKTTLIEGSIQVNAANHSIVLKPGQQSLVSAGKFQVEEGNVSYATAWRDGYIRCGGEDIHAIMRKLARWYNVDVIYEGKISSDGFYGTISRYKNISQALHLLSYSNQVHFKVEGRRVTVTP